MTFCSRTPRTSGDSLVYTPAADSENGKQESLRNIFEADTSIGGHGEDDRFIKNVDIKIQSSCSSPGIYLIMWATNELVASQLLLAWATVAIQIVIPLMVIQRSRVDNPHLFDMQGNGSVPIKISALALTTFLSSTFVGTVDRIFGNTMFIRTKPGLAWVPGLGALFTYISVTLTCIATYCLFKQSPTITDQLLNCVALNFVPDVGVSLTNMLEFTGSCQFDVARYRLNKIAEVWPECEERDELIRWKSLPWSEKMKVAPTMYIANHAQCLISSFIVVGPFVTAYCI